MSPGKTALWMYLTTSEAVEFMVLSDVDKTSTSAIEILDMNHAWLLLGGVDEVDVGALGRGGHLDEVFEEGLDGAAAAHAYMETNANIGKIVVQVVPDA